MKQQRQIPWWQMVITLFGIASCVVLVGMTAFDPAPACSGGQCEPMAVYQHGSPGPPQPICGNNVCEEGESSYNCVIDCGNWCGDGICAAEEVDTCCGPGTDCTVEITCGDGICSACESYPDCYQDCEPPTAAPTNTPEPTDTPLPVPTQPARRTPTPSPTKEEGVDEEPEEPTPTDTPSPTPDVPVCEVIDPNSLAASLQNAFADQMSQDFSPVFLTCDKLPDELCLSLDANLDVATAFEQLVGRTIVNPGTDLNLTLDDVTDLRLNYCTIGGQCVTYAVKSFDTDEGLICFGMLGGAIEPNCEEACIFALGNKQSPSQPEEAEPVVEEPEQPEDKPVKPIFFVLGGVLLLAVLVLIILLYLSSRYGEDEIEEDDYDDEVYPDR